MVWLALATVLPHLSSLSSSCTSPDHTAFFQFLKYSFGKFAHEVFSGSAGAQEETDNRLKLGEPGGFSKGQDQRKPLRDGAVDCGLQLQGATAPQA